MFYFMQPELQIRMIKFREDVFEYSFINIFLEL